MEALKSYLSVINPPLLRHLTGMPGEFIRLFREQTYLSEDIFKQQICGTKHSDSYYRELKSRTIKILQALAIISTPRGGSQVKKKYDICQKKFTIGQKFLNTGDRQEGIRLIKQAYNIASEYEFVHLACELSSILYHNHIYYCRNKKKAQFYADEVERYLQDYTAEKKAEHHFYQVLEQMTRSANPEPIKHALTQVIRWKGTSIKYHVYYATLTVLYGFNTGDYLSIIATCSKTLSFFSNKKGVYTSHFHFFLKSQGIAQMATAQYDDAAKSFERASTCAPNTSYNDYLIRLYSTINALHAGDYKRAYTLYRHNKKCKFIEIRQQFIIIEAYLCFLAATGNLLLEKPFRLGKYLNDTFKEQGDKKGDNINILIAELLVYLIRDRGKFIDRIEAIESYLYRYIKGNGTKRAKWFIRILCMMPRADFHPAALARIAKRQITNLQKTPLRMGDNLAIEIIPFENLLEMILVQLQRKVA